MLDGGPAIRAGRGPPLRQPSSPLERSPALRRAAFLVLSAWMFAGPFAYQVLGDKRPWWRPWVMYREMGVGLYELELRAETGGASRPAAKAR